MIIFHDPRCLEYSSRGHPERPERIARTVPVLKERHPHWEWRQPSPATDDQLLRTMTESSSPRFISIPRTRGPAPNPSQTSPTIPSLRLRRASKLSDSQNSRWKN